MEYYGKRRVPKMIGKVNTLRDAIRKEGTPAVQDAWDEVEEFLDFLYGKVGEGDSEAPQTAQPTVCS